MIPMSDVHALQTSMTAASLSWEFTNYGRAQHGFTHPKDGTAHFHYDSAAESRSWTSMTHFLDTSLGFKAQSQAAVTQIVTEEVSYTDGGVVLKGYVAYPAAASGPLPVLLHVHAWGGLSDFEKGRANRTARELGYIGFAVSIYDVNETAKAAAGMQARVQLVGKYSSAPELFTSRLGAAVSFVKGHAKADKSKIAAVGYCFGGSAVLQFARLGGAEASGVLSVASFHGSL